MSRWTWLVPLLGLALGGCASTSTRLSDANMREDSCTALSQERIAALFERWNNALVRGDADKVVALYATDSILLPTVSNQVRLSAAEKRDYFVHFLENQPRGSIDQRFVDVGCNRVVDAGLYTFRFDKTGAEVHARYTFTWALIDGDWRITSHHSSAMPEKP